MLDQFALRPTPIYGESAADYFIRLFHVNGVPWGSPQLQAMGIRLASLTTGSEAKSIFAALGLPFDKVRQHTPYDAHSKSIGFMGQKLHRDHWTTERRRWCPVCWEEDLSQDSGNRPPVWRVHQRAWWSCTAVASCPIHNVLLENLCPECDRPTFWYVGPMLYCQHKHSLRSRKTRTIPEEHTLADQYILSRFGIWPQAAVPLLSSLSLRDTLDAITVFGAVKLDGPTPSLRALRTDREPEMMSAGLTIAKGWPDAFIDLLATLGSGSGIGKWGVERLYGTLYTWAKDLPQTEFGEEVRRVFFGSVGDSGFVTRRSVVSQYTSSSWVTLKEMAEETGYSTAVVKRFLTALGHDVPATKSGTPVAFSCHVMEHLKAALSKKLNLRELAKYLGVTKQATLDLLRQGLISEDEIHAAARPGFHHVAQAEADRFLAAIRGSAPVRSFNLDSTVSIPRLSQRAAVGGVAGICKMILDGTLTPRAIRAADANLSGVLLKVPDAMAAERLCSGYKYSIDEAAAELDLHPGSARALARAGLLEAKTLQSRQIAVSEVVVEKFRADYMTASEAANQLGTIARYANLELESRGIVPVADCRSVFGLRVSIYRRSDLRAHGTAADSVPENLAANDTSVEAA